MRVWHELHCEGALGGEMGLGSSTWYIGVLHSRESTVIVKYICTNTYYIHKL